jgi:gliding motility-associated-like protein
MTKKINIKLFKSFCRTPVRLMAVLFFIAFIPTTSVALSPPSLRCISVLANGNIDLAWVVDPDTGSVFGGYHIFFATNQSGPFAAVDSIFNYSTTGFTHTAVNANNNIYYYYIKTRDGCCNNYSGSSDTLRSIRMIITPMSNEVVRLTWNQIHTPQLPTSVLPHTLQNDLSGPGFSTFANSSDTNFLDTNYFCNQFINYRVIIDDASGCQSISSIDGELFRDTNGPDQPILDTVSVDYSTGQATISWFPDSSADTQGYVIYQFNGVSYDSIGTVAGINSLFFQFALSDASNLSEIFSVAAYDSCQNLSSLAVNHNTIFVDSQFDKCDASVSLTWNEYNNMIGLNRYEIWYSINGGTWVKDGIVPPNILNYSLSLSQQGASYEIVIRAMGVLGTSSSSNVITVTADIFNVPNFLYVRTASVLGSVVNVLVYADTSADIKSYKLYRSDNGTGGFSVVAQKQYTPQTNISFTDITADPDIRSYFYKVASIDSCGNEFFSENIAKTIHLEVTSNTGQLIDLNWNDYQGWLGPTGVFNIFRVVNGIIQTPQIANITGNTFTYTEDISSIGLVDEFCYVVEALEEQVNVYGFIDSSFSNIACAIQEPYVFIPNAFTPGGKNPIFMPVIVFGDPANYSLLIYNRWGQQVFDSSIPASGWDGSFDGQDCPTGIYVYHLVFKGNNQKEIRRTGTVMLLK